MDVANSGAWRSWTIMTSPSSSDTGFMAIKYHRLKDATRTETLDLRNHVYDNNKAKVMGHVLKMMHREDLLHQKAVPHPEKTMASTHIDTLQGSSVNILVANKVKLVEWFSSDLHILQHAHSDGMIDGRLYTQLRNTAQPEDACIKLVDAMINKGEGTSSQFLKLLKKTEILNTYPQLKEWNSSFALPDHPREGPGRNSGIGGDISSRRREKCTTACPDQTCTACPDQTWSSFRGHCYKRVAGQSTWDKAEQDCVSKEAHLVSIHSLDEHNFVRQLISDNDEFWIGLSDTDKEDDWRWTDESTLSYTNWNAGEPNNDQSANGGLGKGENCAATVSGQKHAKWNDRPCHETRKHVCKLLCPKK